MHSGMNPYNCVGADQPGKAELSTDLLRLSLFVCDDLDLAIRWRGCVGAEVFDAELGEVIARVYPGRVAPNQSTIWIGVLGSRRRLAGVKER